MYYIGVHSTSDLEDGYLGSGFYIKGAILKYGIENFHREILSFHETREEAEDAEANLVTHSVILDESSYNVAKGGQHRFCSQSQKGINNAFYGKTHSEESKTKMREAARKRKMRA